MNHNKIIFLMSILLTLTYAQKQIIVDLKNQKIYAIEDNVIVMDSKISSGKKGYNTPTGKFVILEKQKYHISTIYNLPMPYMLRLTNRGVAIHQGYVPNYPASHGCIRIPKNFAYKLFDWTPHRTQVYVTRNFEDFNKTLITYDQHKATRDQNETKTISNQELEDNNITDKKPDMHALGF
ncbi:MAG: L,D-transpeptidase family protein [Sulfurovaceae bacterium]|nr:L,D-transpeptidase family protein [Sulfurovaceae bacterium]MDD5548392.1 L,D-transpeptidase family protein [Sulfurovaceae bacterium]